MNKVQGKTIISLILILAQGIGKRENGKNKNLPKMVRLLSVRLNDKRAYVYSLSG